MSGRPRIVWFQNYNDHYFVRMIDTLNARGDADYFPVFLSPKPADPHASPIPNSPHMFLGRHDATRPGQLQAGARRYVRQLDCSAVILGGYNTLFKLWVIRHCRRRGIPCCMFADSNIRSERGHSVRRRLKRLLKKIMLASVIADVSRIIPLNSRGVAYWRYYGSPRGKIRPSTYFCRLDLLKDIQYINWDDLFARNVLPVQTKIIFTAARLAPAKGLALMLQAFQRSHLAQQGWIWAIAGEGELRDQLISLAGPDAGRSIFFLGHRPPSEILALMHHSDIFVLPSIYEPHGIVVMESLAVGTPVIASDVCGAVVDLVRPGRTGWRFRNGDPADLQRVLTTALADLRKLQAMRADCPAAFEHWYAQFAPTVVIPSLIRELC